MDDGTLMEICGKLEGKGLYAWYISHTKEGQAMERTFRPAPDLGASLSQRRYHPPTRRRRGRRRYGFPPVLLGALLFAVGFLLGHTAALPDALQADEPPAVQSPWKDGGEQTTQPSNTPGQGISRSDAPWNLLLVNGENPLPEGFQVPTLTQLRNGHAIDSRAYPSLQRMMDDARAEGLQPLVCSSYRTGDMQGELFKGKVQTYLEQGYSQSQAERSAAQWVARPGCSEHQLGLAVDIVDINYQLLDEGQEDTPVQRWLMEHCGEYGFILRYPTGKRDVTGVEYEPWHYRYVGEEAAREIMAQGICLEEYLAD